MITAWFFIMIMTMQIKISGHGCADNYSGVGGIFALFLVQFSSSSPPCVCMELCD